MKMFRTLTTYAVQQKKPKSKTRTHNWKNVADYNKAREWYENYKIAHAKERQAINVYYHKHGPAVTQKKFASYKLTDGWLRETFGNVSSEVSKQAKNGNKKRNTLGRFSSLTNK